MGARLAPSYRETPFWREGLQFPGPFEERELPREADAVVVGGGYTGVSAAIELARRGRSVTLLEKETLGFGASTRNGGITHASLKCSSEELRRRYGAEVAAGVEYDSDLSYEEFERFMSQEKIDCDYKRDGYLHLAYSERQVPKLRAKAAAAGLRWVGRDELSAEVGTSAYYGGYVEEAAGGLHPGKYFAGLARLAAEAGADIHEHLPVTGIGRDEGAFTVATPRGVIRVRDVLVATNGYSDAGVAWHRRRVLPMGSYIIVTEPLEPGLARLVSPAGRVFFDSKNFLYYWRLTPDRRLMFGGRASFAPTTIAHTRDYLYASMLRVHPELEAAGTRVEFAWGGNVAFTFDRLPHLGKNRDGVTHALGYCGVGIVAASFFGRRAAAWICGDEPLAFTKLGFPTVPGYDGNPWFLPAAGLWYRLKDAIG
jgi:glycine/D-amino acid oxidase-like deaminating enzyme